MSLSPSTKDQDYCANNITQNHHTDKLTNSSQRRKQYQHSKMWTPNGSFSSGMDEVSTRLRSSSSRPKGPDQFQKEMAGLSYTHQDIESIVLEDEAFQVLKKSLRQKGCVTNAYLKENVHLYVQHVKQVRERREAARAKRTMILRRTRSLEHPTPPASLL